MKKINLAIVGCGAVADIMHVPNLQRMPEFNVKYLVDVSETRTSYLKNKFRLQSATDKDYRNVLNDESLDAILVTTPPKYHSDIVIAAAEKGKHVFCEKPFALNVQQAEQMVTACSKNGVALVVGFQMRYVPQYRKLKELVDKGFFGELVGGQFTHFTNAFKWPTVSGFQFKQNEGGGALFEMGCHLIDLTYWLLGRPVNVTGKITKMSEKSPIDDTSSIFIEFENGSTGAASVGWNELSVNYVTLFGTGAYAMTGSNSKGDVLYLGKGFVGQQPLRIKSDKDRKTSAYHDELLNFYDCIVKDAKPFAGGEDGLAVTKIIEGAYLSSSQSGKQVSLDTLGKSVNVLEEQCISPQSTANQKQRN
jgi:predicted dehydrogenase